MPIFTKQLRLRHDEKRTVLAVALIRQTESDSTEDLEL